MYIRVRLLNGFTQHLWYQASAAAKAMADKSSDKSPGKLSAVTIGAIVRVPLRNQSVAAVVIDTQSYQPRTSFAIKEIEAVEPFPNDEHYHPFLKQLAAYHQIDPIHFTKRIAHFLGERQIKTRTSKTDQNKDNATPQAVTLTPEQQTVVDALTPHVQNKTYAPTVLHGVTSSGKTEVYKELIKQTHKKNHSSIFMLPEVTLALAFEHRLRKELGAGIPIYGFHSGNTPKEKRILWEQLVAHAPIVIIGVHLPILLPISNLGLIIIDEEHDTGYQEKKYPKIHSKDAAVMRARTCNIPIILGSATPAIATLHNVNARNWNLFRLKKRFSGSFPQVTVASLADKKQRRSFWLTQKLYFAIKDRLEKKEQTLLFLNRRGFSFFVQCGQCSFIFSCRSCSVSLTLHTGGFLRCHYCNHQESLPRACPPCSAPEKEFIKKGVGTQQLVTILEKLFPHARIARADMDTSVKKKQWQQTMEAFDAGELDILVGTQTITKGYDFANVTLVGIIWADLNLSFPIYNAGETTLHQLIQVAGRAGRRDKEGASPSQVIVQTMTDHSIFSHLSEQGYLAFYAQELQKRRMLSYPPCGRLAQIELKNSCERTVDREANKLTNTLREQAGNAVIVLGPVLPPVHMVKKVHTRILFLKSPSMGAIHRCLAQCDLESYASSVLFTPNPLQ